MLSAVAITAGNRIAPRIFSFWLASAVKPPMTEPMMPDPRITRPTQPPNWPGDW
jgi:hypothetical protein